VVLFFPVLLLKDTVLLVAFLEGLLEKDSVRPCVEDSVVVLLLPGPVFLVIFLRYVIEEFSLIVETESIDWIINQDYLSGDIVLRTIMPVQQNMV